MNLSTELELDVEGKKVQVKMYRGMIRKLLYLTTSRPNIMISICMCARFQANNKESHFIVVKKILRHLASTPHIGIWYSKASSISLTGYVDVDFTSSRMD